jgi:hypothetical protein
MPFAQDPYCGLEKEHGGGLGDICPHLYQVFSYAIRARKRNRQGILWLVSAVVVTATSLSSDEGPPTAGPIKGRIVFTDGSQLDFAGQDRGEARTRVIGWSCT